MEEPETEKVKRKVLLDLLTAPTTALPFIAGVTALVATWAFGFRADLGVLAGVAGICAAGGAFFTKLILSGETYAKRALQETQEEAQADQERTLDNLDKRLCQDGDPRTEAALRDLRSLLRAFDDLRAKGEIDMNVFSSTNVLTGVHNLFEQCVRSLEQSLSLWQTAQKLRTKVARDPLLKQREDILQDVGKSISQLGQTLVAIQKIGSGDDAKSELARIGEELDQHLVVAKQVEQRLKAFENQLQSGVKE